MKNESLEQSYNRYACIRDMDREREEEVLEFNLLVFDCLKEEGTSFFGDSLEESGLRIAYEVLIYFLVNEDYARCAVIRKVLNDQSSRIFRKKYSLSKKNQKPIY
ncbi:MAG: hypothetical protein NT153_05255 [Bacteroidetes bacterium]|nr:hypothetical protein [Bacteroidota bacterium]